MWRGGCIIRSVFLGNIKAAYDRLVAVSPDLSSRSTDDALAIALAKKSNASEFAGLQDDRTLVAAADRLATKGLNGASTDEQVATALADPTALAGLKADRDLLAADGIKPNRRDSILASLIHVAP